MLKNIKALCKSHAWCLYTAMSLIAIGVLLYCTLTEVLIKDVKSKESEISTSVNEYTSTVSEPSKSKTEDIEKRINTVFDFHTILIGEKTFAVNFIAAFVAIFTIVLGFLSVSTVININSTKNEIKDAEAQVVKIVANAKELETQIRSIREKSDEQEEMLNEKLGRITHSKFFHDQEGNTSTTSYVESEIIHKVDKILYNPSAVQYIQALAIKAYNDKEWHSSLYLWKKVIEKGSKNFYVKHYAFLSAAFKLDEMKIPASDSRWNDIKDYFNKVTADDEKNSILWIDRGDLYARLARKGGEKGIQELWKTAEECYIKADEIDPDNVTILTNLARLLSVKARVETNIDDEIALWNRANGYFEKAQEIQPENVLIKRYLGFYLIYHGYANLDNKREELWEKAKKYCHEMMKNKEYFNVGRYTLAILLTYEGKATTDESAKHDLWNRADNYYYELTKYLIPEDSETWYNWSRLRELQAERVEGAKKEDLTKQSIEYLSEAKRLNEPFFDFLEFVYSKDTCDINKINQA